MSRQRKPEFERDWSLWLFLGVVILIVIFGVLTIWMGLDAVDALDFVGWLS